MTWRKYKYYFKKPRSAIVKDILYWLMISGAVAIAATSPFFLTNLLRGYRRWKKYPKRKVLDTFYNLRRQGLINFRIENNQIYISLTEKGKEKADWLQIDSLKIKKPKKWDDKWRLVTFDISQLKKLYREAFRGKLKEIGFRPLQKSIWVHPFDCSAEIDVLKKFFGLTEKEMRLVIAESIGDDSQLKSFFKLT